MAGSLVSESRHGSSSSPRLVKSQEFLARHTVSLDSLVRILSLLVGPPPYGRRATDVRRDSNRGGGWSLVKM